MQWRGPFKRMWANLQDLVSLVFSDVMCHTWAGKHKAGKVRSRTRTGSNVISRVAVLTVTLWGFAASTRYLFPHLISSTYHQENSIRSRKPKNAFTDKVKLGPGEILTRDHLLSGWLTGSGRLSISQTRCNLISIMVVLLIGTTKTGADALRFYCLD